MGFLLSDYSSPREVLIDDEQSEPAHTSHHSLGNVRLPLHWTIVCMAVLWVASPCRSRAQNPADTAVSCDSTFAKQTQGGEYGYTRREDRCEGLHKTEVAGRGILRMIALVRETDTSLSNLPAVHISWRDVGDTSIASVALLARSTRPHVFYAMTTVRPARTGGYEWNTDWPHAEGLKPDEFGYLGWLGNLRVPEAKRVYIPLQISGSSQRDTTGAYSAVFIPGEPLREIFVSVGELGSDGTVKNWLYQRQAVGRMLYSRDRPLTIAIPRSQARFLKVVLSTQTTSGVPVAYEFVTLSP